MLAKKGFFFVFLKKRSLKISLPACFHQNKAIYNFYKREKGPKARHCFVFRLELGGIKLKEIKEKLHAAAAINSTISLSHIRNTLNQIK